MYDFIGIIPARFESTRFPGKPLCDIHGRPMIWHVYHQAIKWEHFSEVYVATDDQRIMEVCREQDIPCIITSPDCSDCLDRAWEAVEILNNNGKYAETYIVIQGDEPLFNVETLDVNYDYPCINFYTKATTDIDDPNAVKVVLNINDDAMYFSRFALPYHNINTTRSDREFPVYKQIGVYAFNAQMLQEYHNLKPTMLENAEGIGLNRLLESDYCVNMKYTAHDSISVDTPADKEKVIQILKDKNR